MANDLKRLEAIADLLGPNVWIELDRISFPWFFEHELDETQAERREGVKAAKTFAKGKGLTFKFDRVALTARFGRAYFKRDET